LKLVVLLAALALALAGAAIAHAADAGAPPLVPRNLAPLAGEPYALVQLQDGAGGAERDLRAAGGTLVSGPLRVWRVPSGAARTLAPRLALSGDLRDVEPDAPRTAYDHLGAGDPLLPQQWWLGRIGADQVEPPGPGVPITVVDTGIDLSHPEFAGRPNTFALNPQTVVVNPGRTRNEIESDAHGTAVASVAAAPANGVGIVGVYPQAALYSWDASPLGVLRTSDVIRGIEAARCPGVINLSLGGPVPIRQEAEAVIRAFARGCIVVAASGNERQIQGTAPNFPASLPHVLTVGSIDPLDRLSVFSSPSPGMDLVAPGEQITVAWPLMFAPSGFLEVNGTSFSAPIVAGATAWVWTARPGLEKTQVFELMRRSARPLTDVGRNPDTGFGRLDLPTALTMPVPPVDPFEPNDEIHHVRPGGLLRNGQPPLTRPGNGRAVVNARLDAVVDPRDVYRVWVPANHRVITTLTGPASVELRYAGPTAIRNTSRLGPRRQEIVNRTRQGTFVYITALIAPRAQPALASYRINVTTGRAPAPVRR
jgi:hypothetical protein